MSELNPTTIPTTRSELTAEIARELLDYDPLSGALTWKKRDRKWFSRSNQWKNWNGRYAGRQA